MPDDLRQRYADALKAAAHACDGSCGLTEEACQQAHPISWAGTARQGHADEVTWLEGTTTAIAEACAAVRDAELDEARRERNSLDVHLTRAYAALARVRALHRVHRCAVDGHLLKRTPTPCGNDGLCSCGHLGACPTAEILDTPETSRDV